MEFYFVFKQMMAVIFEVSNASRLYLHGTFIIFIVCTQKIKVFINSTEKVYLLHFFQVWVKFQENSLTRCNNVHGKIVTKFTKTLSLN